jgi:hypothetical protein
MTIQRCAASSVIQLDGEGWGQLLAGAKALYRAGTIDMILEAVDLILSAVAYAAESLGTAVASQVGAITKEGLELYRLKGELDEPNRDATENAETWQKIYAATGSLLAAIVSLIVSATGHVSAGVLVGLFGGKGLSLLGRAVGFRAVFRSANSEEQILLAS